MINFLKNLITGKKEEEKKQVINPIIESKTEKEKTNEDLVNEIETIGKKTPSVLFFIVNLFTKSELEDICRENNLKITHGKKELIVSYIVDTFNDKPKKFLNFLTIEELKCLCDALNERVTGIKEDLIERIIREVKRQLSLIKK